MSTSSSSSSSSPLLSLPTELIVRILAHLPCAVLLSLRPTSRFFREVIDTDTALQYDIELSVAGMLHNPAPEARYALADRLRLLKARERAWHRLEFSRVLEIAVPHPPSSIYDLTGGIFLLGESYSRRLPTWRPTDAARHIDLRAALLSVGPYDIFDGPWRRIDVKAKTLDVGIAAQEHNLIAFVTYGFLNANQFLAEMRVHLIEISTGEYHSAASQPIIELPHMPFLPGNCSVSIEIVGDTLGILFNLSRLLHGLGAGPAIKFFLYNWKTGKLRFTKTTDDPMYNAFCFLSPDVIVLPNAAQNSLELYSLTPPASHAPAELEITCTLALPQIAPNSIIHRIWCRAEPNGLATRAGTFASAPFFSDPARAIIIFNVVAQDAAGTLQYLSFVVHRAALIAHLPAPSPPPTVEWDEWGPGVCLWVDGNGLAIRWITVTCGQRFVVVRRDSPTPLQVYDFNARSMRRRYAAAHADGLLVPESAYSESAVDPQNESRTVFVRRKTLLSSLFEEPVVSELPHAVTETMEEYEYESVMMDEGVLIGVETDDDTDNIGSLVLHAVGPVI